MAFSLKTCTFLLVVAAAFCVQLYEATFVPGSRCLCYRTIKFTQDKISDFRVIDKKPGCEKTEVIVTVQKQDMSTEDACLNLEGRQAKVLLACWNNKINRDESQKTNCLRRRKAE